MSILSELWDKIMEWFEDIGEEIVNGLKPLAKEIAKNGGALLLNAAFEAVRAAEAQGGSGSDKFNAAKSTVIAKLEDEGIDVVINAVHGAIESAVARLKEQP